MSVTWQQLLEFVNYESVHLPEHISLQQEISVIDFDTRRLINDSFFVPLIGTRDGHEFIQEALHQGALSFFWQADHGPCPYTETPHIVVLDTQKAYQEIAQGYLRTVNPKVVAITGSNGKTTTKDMTYAVLKQSYRTYATVGNFNNELGVPYTILSMPENTEVLVLEMGMDHPGDLLTLVQIAPPDIAAITLIGESHIEYFGSREAIAKSKLEIIDTLPLTHPLVIPGNEPLLTQYMRKSQTTVTFGISETHAYDITATDIVKTAQATYFRLLSVPNESFKIPVLGDYNVLNALIAIAIGMYFNIDIKMVNQGLQSFKLTKQRTEWCYTDTGIPILSDVYNANPTAVKAILSEFTDLKTSKDKRVILGDMLELGAQSKIYHQALSDDLDPEEILDVWLYGTCMKDLYDQLVNIYDLDHIHYYEIGQEALFYQDVKQSLSDNDIWLVKGSRGMQLDKLVQYLLDAQ